jgi:hypothetical protein
MATKNAIPPLDINLNFLWEYDHNPIIPFANGYSISTLCVIDMLPSSLIDSKKSLK